jgi:heterodisulfide reductase subunit C
MLRRMTFADEIANMLYASESNPVHACIQCGTCAGTCPAADFMDHSPRQLIAMIRANAKQAVLRSNTYWTCASCYSCTVRCPKGIDIAAMMYGLKRYAVWRNHITRDVIGADFSRRFARMIVRRGRSYEPELAVPYLLKHGVRALIDESYNAVQLFLKGRIALRRPRVRSPERLRSMLGRIIPFGRAP